MKGRTGSAARAMRHIAVTVPAVTVERLRTHHNAFHLFLVTADAVFLDDALGLFAGAYGNRDVPGREGVYILGALSSFFEIVHNEIIVGQMTIHTLGELLMWSVIPILVLRVHHMAIGTRFWCMPPVGGRVGNEHECSQRDDRE